MALSLFFWCVPRLTRHAGVGRVVYVFVESSGECVGVVATGKGDIDGGDGNGKGQTKEIPKTTRFPKLNQKCKLAHNRPFVPLKTTIHIFLH